METKDDSVHFREDIVTQLRDLDTRLKQALNVQDTTLIQSFTLQFDYLLRSAILYWRSPGNGLVPLLAEFQLLSLNYLKKDKLQLLKYLGDCTHRTLQIVDEASKPTESEVVIPFALVEGTRQYIEQIVQQVNGCYVSGWYDACAVMTRRLVETLIIEAFEAHKIESKIKDSNGDYLYLKDLVVRALEESTWNLSRNVKKALPRLKDIGNQAATSSALADGNSHYFHIRSVDNAGNWQSTVHLGPFFIDATPPTMEAIDEAQGQYYDTAPSFSNFGFDDDVALDDGWYQVDSYTGNWTVLFTDATGTSWDDDGWTIPGFDALSEGSHTTYFKASDDAGIVDSESGEWSWQFYKDTIPPSNPTGVSSTSHTLSVWPSDNTVDITWTDATDNTSGLDGYSILWDTNPTTIPDQSKNIEEGVQATTSPALPDGNSHYFHIRSVDNAGNWQSTVHLGPIFIDTAPPSILGTTHEVNCDILPSTTVEAFKGDVSKGSTVSDPTSGDYTFVASRNRRL